MVSFIKAILTRGLCPLCPPPLYLILLSKALEMRPNKDSSLKMNTEEIREKPQERGFCHITFKTLRQRNADQPTWLSFLIKKSPSISLYAQMCNIESQVYA